MDTRHLPEGDRAMSKENEVLFSIALAIGAMWLFIWAIEQ